MVIVYTNPTCGPCKATFYALDKRGIQYKKVDISVDDKGRRDMEALGYSVLPVVYINKNFHWNGFRPDMMDRITK